MNLLVEFMTVILVNCLHVYWIKYVLLVLQFSSHEFNRKKISNLNM